MTDREAEDVAWNRLPPLSKTRYIEALRGALADTRNLRRVWLDVMDGPALSVEETQAAKLGVSECDDEIERIENVLR